MTLGALFGILALIGIIVVVVWNFVPSMRDKMRGWSTVIEAGGAFVYWALGQLTGGLQDAVNAGYVPAWLVGYIPVIMLVYIIWKRFITTTPVGGAK